MIGNDELSLGNGRKSLIVDISFLTLYEHVTFSDVIFRIFSESPSLYDDLTLSGHLFTWKPNIEWAMSTIVWRHGTQVTTGHDYMMISQPSGHWPSLYQRTIHTPGVQCTKTLYPMTTDDPCVKAWYRGICRQYSPLTSISVWRHSSQWPLSIIVQMHCH